MFYSAATLRKLASDAYAPSAGCALRPIAPDPAQGLADFLGMPGQTVRLVHRGGGRLLLHRHAWSGRVAIFGAHGAIEYDLGAELPSQQWIEFSGSDTAQALLIANVSPVVEGPGSEVWLCGVEFDRQQDWLPMAVPATAEADLVFGEVGSLLVPHLDSVIGKTIRHTGAWARTDLALFDAMIAPGAVVFDVGAHIGHHAVHFSTLVGANGQVFCFEPQTALYRFAMGNLAINACRNVRAFCGALGEADGHARMRAVPAGQPANLGEVGLAFSGDAAPGEAVEVWSLDSLVNAGKILIDRLDFMKIDVQSFELPVLKGARNTITRFKPAIFIEISPYWMQERGYDYREIYYFLRMVGYEFKHFDEGYGIVDGIRQWDGSKSEEWDVLCIATVV